MTFTVIGRCSETGAVGLAITSCSINGGRTHPHEDGLDPEFTDDGVLLSSQSHVNPMLAHKSFEILRDGASFEELERELRAFDEYFEHRQLGIMRVSGETYVHTGEHCAPVKDHHEGDEFLVMGNALREGVIPAMANAFERSEGEELADRLLGTLAAGRDAGGQVLNGEDLPELAGAVRVYDGAQPYPAVDLRVDFDLHAVEKLRRLYERVQEPSDEYWDTYYRRPDETGPETLEWIIELADQQI